MSHHDTAAFVLLSTTQIMRVPGKSPDAMYNEHQASTHAFDHELKYQIIWIP